MKKEVELPTIKLTYKMLANSNFQAVLRKLFAAEVDNVAACRINKISKSVVPWLDKMGVEYTEKVQKPYQTKIKETLGWDVNGPRPAPEALSPEDKEKMLALDKELSAMQEEFGKTEVVLEVLPLGPQHLKDIKLSSNDIEALGEFFDESGKYRTEYFRTQLNVVEGDKVS